MTKWAFYLLPFLLINCSSNKLVAEHEDIRKLDVYYIPWDLKTEARWTEYEVRDTSISYVSFVCINDNEILENFSKCFIPNQFEPKSYKNGVSPYMLIDVIYSSGRRDKLIIGPKIFIEYHQKTYLITEELKTWIEDSIPKASFPYGEKGTPCSR